MKSKISILIIVLFSLVNNSFISAQSINNYSVADKPWEEGLGNHRAIIDIKNPADAVLLDFDWRRHDNKPEKRKFIIINAKTGEKVSHIKRLEVNNEKCKIAFGPVKEAGLYYFYYLPFKPDAQYGAYSYGYRGRERSIKLGWVIKNSLYSNNGLNKLDKAICTEIQARKEFDSFFPMEVTALKTEVSSIESKEKSDYIATPESREFPIKMRDNIPYKWIKDGIKNDFNADVFNNEYYAFQIGVYAFKEGLNDVQLEFSDLQSVTGNKIPAKAFTCFNTTGVSPYGEDFTKIVNVEKGKIQALWVGVDVTTEIPHGEYTGKVIIQVKGKPNKTIDLKLNILNKTIVNRGDNEPWRHSRLRWLNSRIGLADSPVAPYSSIKEKGDNKLELTGKEIKFTELGLPSSIKVYDNEILAKPLEFVLQGEKLNKFNLESEINKSGTIVKTFKGTSNNFEITTIGTTEFDGHINYKIKLVAKSEVKLENFEVKIPFKTSIAQYIMGMGLSGRSTPSSHSAKWRGPHDSFWIGNTYGGLHVEMRGDTYSGPLLNLYKPDAPKSWDNNGRGGFGIEKQGEQTVATINTGKREFSKGEEITYEFSLIITPVKKINTKSQFTDRYYHNGDAPMPNDEEISSGLKVVNVHHANKYNPYINYPFIATDEMSSFVDQMHDKGLKVKIYYTIRELTDRVTEIWALRSLGNEVLETGKGGGYPWLQEHFVSDYDTEWYSPLDGDIDASVLTSLGDSRWFNYYLEGLRWLVEEVDIDGLYLDDVSYDRRILKRMRRILDEAKPGCVLDLHSNTGFSQGPATQYTEFFPYLDKLWFGESFNYDRMSADNWLVEVSGLPFGLMGDMLHAGGNPWRGMVYGMTVRYPWYTDGVTCDPRQIWSVWDSFGIADAKMIGYWDKKPVVTTSNKNVKATAYVKDGKIMVSIASWAITSVKVKLNIDWKAVGLDKSKVKIHAPKIDNFQPEKLFNIDDEISVKPTKGWLLVVE